MKLSYCLASAVLLFTSSNLCLAQRVESGTVEISGSGGFSGGFPDLPAEDILTEIQLVDPLATLTNLSDTEWNVGAGVGAGVADNLLVKFDWVRTRLFSATIDVPSGPAIFDTHANLDEFTAGIEYLFGDHAVVPFVAVGGGIVRFGVNVSTDVGVGVDVGVTETEAAYNVGGGIRGYVTDHFGVRPAIQFVHAGGTFDQSFWRASFGAFYSFN